MKSTIQTAGFTGYNEIAPDNATYPYLTYEIVNTNPDNEATEAIYVDIDGWDNYSATGSTVRLETMMTAIVRAFNKKRLESNGVSATFYLYDRKMIRDSDDSIRRRKLMFEVRSIGKE